MSFGFRSCFGLAIALFACPACEWVLGDIPDKVSIEPESDAGGDSSMLGATTSSTGSAGASASVASSTGVGGSNGSGGGASGGSGGVTGNGGNAGSSATGGGGVAGASGSSVGMGGNGGLAGSAGMGGKAGASGAGGASGGAGGTSGAAGSAGSGAPDGSAPRDSAADADPCDMDGDGFRSILCAGGNDCDDNAKLVYPNEPNFYEDPTHVGGTDFDYDCDGIPRPQYGSINCAGLGLTCNQAASAFLGTTAPACGQSGRFGHCVVSGLSCVEQVEQLVKKMPCK